MQLDADRVVGAVFVDFQKAFDSVSHSTLITKLYHPSVRDKRKLIAMAEGLPYV